MKNSRVLGAGGCGQGLARLLMFAALCACGGALAAGAPTGPNAGAPDEWPSPSGDAAGSYHSALTDIDAKSVSRLGLAWEYPLHTYRGQEATPIEVQGVLYGVGNFGRVYAVDGASGAERWTYDPDADGQWGRYACCDAVNRGVVERSGILYVESLDGYLHAIDAATGRRVWKVDTLPVRGARAPYASTGGPVVAGKLVLIGSGGGDFKGVRGYVAAFDAETGALRWRFYTVPRDPKLGPQDQPEMRDAVKTWDPRSRWDLGGGGAVWDGIAFDPALDLVYIGTGNASPYNIKADGRSGGDDLFTDSIVALHAASGAIAWHYQVVPGDMWDFDSTQKMILADLEAGPGGSLRPVLMQASKNGFFYVLDRRDGTFISARPFAFQNWSKRLDPVSGRPVLSASVDYSRAPKLVYPWEGGAHSWQPMSFDPASKQVFIPAQEYGNVLIDTENRRAGFVEGQFTSVAIATDDYDPKALASLYGALPSLQSLGKHLPLAPRRGFLRAWDPVRQRLRWEVATASGWDGGVLSTAGGLVFQGDITGKLNVYAADTGALVKSLALGTTIMAAPMSYRIGGVQYIAVMAGYGGGDMGVPFPERSAAYRYGNENRIIALKLDGKTPPLPPEIAHARMPEPPPPIGTAAQIAAGEVLYNRFCGRCHLFDTGMLPDLRRLNAGQHAVFLSIVRGGALSSLGMGRFDDVISEDDARAIEAYVLDQAWQAFKADSAAK